ncbi:Nucleosome assembly protein 1-like 1 [Exaiptasia diaphana]|nr:Nucleosome assembly protein 1-like 1 [Exaiptasia diaphana]
MPQDGLSRLVGQTSGYVESLPKSVKRRIKALKNIQAECCKIEGRFYEEVHALECKYAEKFKPLYEKRKNIANGHVEPTDKECEWPSDDEQEESEEKEEKEEKDKAEVDQLSQEVKDKVKVNDDTMETEVLSEDTKGIPEFWLTSMKNVDMIAEMIQEHDEPILKHLTEIKVVFVGPDSNVENSQYPLPTPMGFVLEFHFTPNPFFTNTILTKSYKMKCEPDEDDPFSFEGPEIVHTSGCKIDWKKGKNVTQKVVKKKQRHKGRGQTRFINKTVKNDSFFNFFSPPEVTEEDEDMDDDTEALLAADFEIGHFFRERLIPKAVLYFTGEAGDDDFDEDDDEDEDALHDGDRDDDDDDDDPDYNPPPPGEKPQECKQQ